MAWNIEIKDNNYRIWSTITDSYITEFLTRDEMLKYIFWNRFDKFVSENLKLFITFPIDWIDKDGKYIHDNLSKEALNNYYKLEENQLLKYEEFLKALNNLNISLRINDENYSVSSDDIK